MSSITAVQNALTTGSDDRRPNASRIPIGKESTIPPTASMRVTNNPPHKVVGTSGSRLVLLIPGSRTKIMITAATIQAEAKVEKQHTSQEEYPDRQCEIVDLNGD